MVAGRVIVVLLAGAVACSRSQPGGRGTIVAARSIDAVLAAHTDSLLAIPGVVGTAVGLCGSERCIKVLVANSKTAVMHRIPSSLEGYRVVVEVTGAITPR